LRQLIEAAARILLALPERISKLLKKLGAEVRTGARVQLSRDCVRALPGALGGVELPVPDPATATQRRTAYPLLAVCTSPIYHVASSRAASECQVPNR
jgi:hypothetical protein